MSDGSVKRRDFVAAGAAAAASLVIVKPASVYGTPANDAIRLGIIGSGNRGSSVGREFINAGARVVALHDLFEDQLAVTRQRLDRVHEEKGLPKLEDKMLFQGPQAYQQLLASPDVDAVLLTSPPYFHPEHFEAVVEAKKHCYLEKPVASDVAGTRRVEKAGKKAAGKISMAVGFQSRYASAYQEMVRRIHEGAIGDIVCAQTYYYARDLTRKAKPEMPALEQRVRNWVFDRVLSGDILVEQNIHVLDITNWVLRAHPVSAMATGGKKTRLDVDTWDHYNVTFVYPGNVHVSFNSTQYGKNTFDHKTQRFLGTTGYAEASFAKYGVRIVGDQPWDAGVEDGLKDALQRKVAAFVESIRSGNLQNEVAQGCESTLTAILGRTAAYEKKDRDWDDIANSNDRWKEKVDISSLRATPV